MEPGSPDVINQLPATGNPMEPESGTYGKVAETDRLKQALNSVPGGGPDGAAQGGGLPPMGSPQGAQMPAPPPGGVPDVLMGPSSQPNIDPATPLEGGMGAPQQPAQTVQNHIAALEALIKSPTTSSATKAWARSVLDRYEQ